MQIKAKVTFQVKLPAQVEHRGKYYVSCCPLLDVYSQGETQQKALKNLKEATSLFLISCFERGVLDKVLTESGFVPASGAYDTQRTEIPVDYSPSINVPLPFLVNKQHSTGSSCRV